MKNLSLRQKRLVLFGIDFLLVTCSLLLSFILRYDGRLTPNIQNYFFTLLPLALFLRMGTFLQLKFYSRMWRYSSLNDLTHIIKGVAISSLLLVTVAFFINRAAQIPRSIMVIDFFLLIMLMGGSRLAWRLWSEKQKRRNQQNGEPHTRVFIFGAGDAGAHLLKYLKSFSSTNFQVVGFIDDDPGKKNMVLHGIRVLGSREDLGQLATAYQVKELLIAAPQIQSRNLSELVTLCNRHGLNYKIATAIQDLNTNELRITKIRAIQVSDLLNREQVSLDLSSINQMIGGKRILVTGAGGSIGSELCEQILEYEPSVLVMVDIGENYLYDLQMALEGKKLNTETHFIFGSVTNEKKMESLFERFQPQMVFHAAAHKHVPLMEQNVNEAITNNILGTRTTAILSAKHNVAKFILVSTDKVVQPSSVMGMTKKVAEAYIHYMAGRSSTKFLAVRFGNVLGSNGSVVPLFKKQIENGGPVTVTHPDMTRYFMLIPEAAQLILQAAAIGEKSNIFLLEMGKPVKIIELAEKMIRLAGYEPDQDIRINFTGMRKGEKLAEKLVDEGEVLQPTQHEKIKLLINQNGYPEEFGKKIEELCQEALNRPAEEARKQLIGFIDKYCLFKRTTQKEP